MYTVHIKDRGRDLAYHTVDLLEEAREVARVYELLGYRLDRIEIEHLEPETVAA